MSTWLAGVIRRAGRGVKQALVALAWPAALVTVGLLAAVLTARYTEARREDAGVLSGREVRLHDEAGRVLIRMRAGAGGPVVELMGSGSTPKLTLGVVDEAPYMLLANGSRVGLSALETGARMDLYGPGPADTPLVSLSSFADACDVTLRDTDGRTVAVLAHTPSGAGLRLKTGDQREAVTMGSGKEGGWIATYGPDGKARWSSLMRAVEHDVGR